jgi:hypothetical protein
MRIYTVEEAAQIAVLNETDILDLVRAGELPSYTDAEPSFPVPYTRYNNVTHRSLIGISAESLSTINDLELEHRWQVLLRVGDAEDEDEARAYVQRALVLWYGAALDDPKDREAAGVIQGLEVFAGYLGLMRDGTIHKRPGATTLSAVA